MGLSSAPASEEALDERFFAPREIWRVLSLHRWLAVAVTAAIVAAVALWSYSATPYYRSTVRVLIDRDHARAVSFQEIYNLGTGADDYYTTQYKLLESRAVAAAALASMPAEVQEWFGQHRDPVTLFMQLRRIMPVRKSRLVDVSAEHPNPGVARQMANAIVDCYVNDIQQRRDTASGDALTKLRRDAEELQQKLLAAQQVAQDFKIENQIVSTNDRQSLAAARLEALTKELAGIERTRRESHERLRSARQALQSAKLQTGGAVDATALRDLAEVLESPVVGDFKRELVEARQALSELSQNFKPKHPRILALTKRVAAVEQQLGEEVQSIYDGLERRCEQAVALEDEVRQRLETRTQELLRLEQKAIQHQIYVSEADNVRRLYETVLARLEEVEVINDDNTTNVHRIGEAEVTRRPVRPRPLLNIALALLVGLLASVGLAFTVDLCDRSIKTAADATALLGLPVLGVVPRLEGKRERRGPLDPETLDPRSPVSEAFRTIRTSLVFSDLGRDMRTLLVTSAAPEEGKSMVSINLAVSMARSGKRVLLIDADMRRPRLHRAFEVDPEEGLSSLLVGTRKPEEVVLPTAIENLSLLPCGVIPPNPVELLASGMTPPLLEQLLQLHDLVLIDTPPVGIISDACVLATRVDRAIMVVRSFATDRQHCRRALAQLRKVDANLAGLIFNVSTTRGDRYGRYDYEYRYGYEPKYELADDELALTSSEASS